MKTVFMCVGGIFVVLIAGFVHLCVRRHYDVHISYFDTTGLNQYMNCCK